MIILEHIKKNYGDLQLLRDVNAVINDGEIVAVIGPSGTGKSTLLHCINLLEHPTKGRIIVDGTDITAPGCDPTRIRKKMGMVFQNFNLFEHLTVIENIMLAQTELMGRTRQQAYDRSMELLRTVGLAERALAYPKELSGGQKQRIAIARTLATDPEIILFDEPTSALDHTMKAEVQAVIRDVAQMNKTIIIVTHELDFAHDLCSRVLYLDDGIIYEDGTPGQVIDSPVGEKTRRFIHKLKVLEIPIKSRDHDFLASVADINRYCVKNRIADKTNYHIQSVFEELCRQILLPVLKHTDIFVTVEYSPEKETAVITAEYNGEPFDPSKTDNKLAYALIKGIAESTEYETSGEGYSNRFTAAVK